MKVLVTGNLGYVGNVLTRMLLEKNFEVVGCDTGFYPQGFLGLAEPKIIQIKKDIRNLTEDDLDGVSSICHLAALSNDPLGEINPNLICPYIRKDKTKNLYLTKMFDCEELFDDETQDIYEDIDDTEDLC